MNGYMTALARYAQFTGRSRRLEYWSFVLVNGLIIAVLEILAFTTGFDSDTGFHGLGLVFMWIAGIYALAVLLPSLAVQWRRYQDIGWPGAVSIVGWFIPLLTFIVAFIPGNPGANQYGPDPKA
ncbi:DUF805 domain-containing protein [Demequina soli]|uniref:DUF805 domain-containing protein n=1 Tax=Demequina soli TaxID=1638987 RepID=UPI0009E5286E|nr:DUF805 domain-containing protein [Demequina soli]